MLIRKSVVSTQWVADHLGDPKVRIVEVDYDPTSNYLQGHVPGAVLFNWKKDLNDPMTRDILSEGAARSADGEERGLS